MKSTICNSFFQNLSKYTTLLSVLLLLHNSLKPNQLPSQSVSNQLSLHQVTCILQLADIIFFLQKSIINTANMPGVNWKDPASTVRLLSAVLAAHPDLKLKYDGEPKTFLDLIPNAAPSFYFRFPAFLHQLPCVVPDDNFASRYCQDVRWRNQVFRHLEPDENVQRKWPCPSRSISTWRGSHYRRAKPKCFSSREAQGGR